jgi:parvulin-like peptidyl-prolyl isomerase
MKRKFKMIAAVLLAAASLSGCADTSWAVKVNGQSVQAGVYIAMMISYADQALADSSSSAVSGTASAASASGWSKQIDGMSADAWVKDKALSDCKELAIIEHLSKQKNITLTSAEQNSAASTAESYITNDTSGIFTENGVASSSLERIIKAYSYSYSKLFDAYFGEGGEQAVSEADIKTYFKNNYVHIKQIFLSTKDDEGNAYAADKIAEIKEKANSVLAKAKANKSDFDSLVKTYNEDPGMTQNPDGYIFSRSSNYYQVFIDAAYDMKTRDVRLIESEEGFHVMYKLPVDADSSSFADYKGTVLREMKQDDFQKLLEAEVSKAKVEVNQDTINRYSPTKLKGI